MLCPKCKTLIDIRFKTKHDIYVKDGKRYISERCPCGHINEVEVEVITDPDLAEALTEAVTATFH